ncbi:hypothetical protein SALBM311S_07723 [Streptomyces alboniger]
MTDDGEVRCRAHHKRTLWCFVGVGAAGTVLAALRIAYRGGLPDVWTGVGTLLALVGVVSLHAVTARVDADAYGLRRRTLLRRGSVPWPDIADLRVRLKYANTPRVQETRRVSLVLRDGREQLLPLPHSWTPDDPDFDTKLAALRALHRRYGIPESSHVPVISNRTAGRGWAGSLSLCVLLLAGAAVAAWLVPHTASQEREWRSAAPCTAETPAPERGECMSTRRPGAVAAAAVLPPSHDSAQLSHGDLLDGRGGTRHLGPPRLGLARHPSPYARGARYVRGVGRSGRRGGVPGRPVPGAHRLQPVRLRHSHRPRRRRSTRGDAPPRAGPVRGETDSRGAARSQERPAPRGGDGDSVPRGWHIAELDDAGTLIRLAAAPADLRILRELGPALPPSRVTTPPRGRTRQSHS